METKITIEKGIPIPNDGRGRIPKYPWNEMEVGDSFFAAGMTTKELGSSLVGARKRTGKNFTSRTVEGGVRVWRIA